MSVAGPRAGIVSTCECSPATTRVGIDSDLGAFSTNVVCECPDHAVVIPAFIWKADRARPLDLPFQCSQSHFEPLLPLLLRLPEVRLQFVMVPLPKKIDHTLSSTTHTNNLDCAGLEPCVASVLVAISIRPFSKYTLGQHFAIGIGSRTRVGLMHYIIVSAVQQRILVGAFTKM